jgi:hypothetical protein
MFPAELDLRDAPRKPFRCPAWVTVGDQTHACTLVDLSETGAGLIFQKPDAIPETFTLHLMNRVTVSLPCHVVWRNGPQVGVAFFAESERRSARGGRFERVT